MRDGARACMGISSGPSRPSSLQSAGTMLPNWMTMMSPGTSSLASMDATWQYVHSVQGCYWAGLGGCEAAVPETEPRVLSHKVGG